MRAGVCSPQRRDAPAAAKLQPSHVAQQLCARQYVRQRTTTHLVLHDPCCMIREQHIASRSVCAGADDEDSKVGQFLKIRRPALELSPCRA